MYRLTHINYGKYALTKEELEKMSEGLEALTNLDSFKNMKLSEIKLFEIIEKELKALEIIKKKNVDIQYFKKCKTVKQYNNAISFQMSNRVEYQLTQAEFALLKEVLENG